jgi:hypothetical protein
MKQTLRTLTAGAMLAVVAGCATVPAEDSRQGAAAAGSQQPLVIGTGSPVAALQEAGSDLPGFTGPAVVPPGTLRVSKVARKKAEMREGPGVSFALADRILEEGTKVIVFEQHGVWVKVLSVGEWDSGWLHVNTISPPRLNKTRITINVAKFPTVLAVRPVTHGLAFAGGDSVRFSDAIPKGRMFRALQITGDRTLVWIAERNDIVWIKRKDMQ